MATSHAHERWERIERAFQATLNVPPEERADYLDTACGQDPGLRREVEALLTARAVAGDFLEAPLDTQRAASLIEATSEDLSDLHDVGPYRIVGRLGQGGMGVVYLAQDSRLDRQVALKFLPTRLGLDPAAKRRFVAEAKAVSTLDDPHIATVYEIGETADSELYIAMAYCAGETLRDRLERGALPVGEAVEVAAQIAEGLAAAHAKGVVHRDVKPGNVILSVEGRVKIVDFGIARATGSALTGTGLRLGTPAYMSPEQTRGQTVDHRTDLWSLGVVLYEMLAGVRPFSADGYEAILYGIRHDPPRPLDKVRPGLLPRVLGVIDRCLQKDPANRYPDASTLREDLRAAAGGIGLPVTVASRSAPRRAGFLSRLVASKVISGRRPFLLSAAAVSLLGLTGLYLFSHHRDSGSGRGQASVARAGSSIAVLPFDVRGSGLEAWREGMVDVLSTNLSGLPGVRVVHSRTVLARWREHVKDAAAADLETALDVARRTGARYALIGSVVASGPGMRLTAEVYEVPLRRMIGAGQVEGPADSIFGLVDQLSIKVLRVTIPDGKHDMSRFGLARITTSSLPALKAYLEGEALFRRSDFESAARAYRRAVEADSTFALAWARLAPAVGWGGAEADSQAYSVALVKAARFADRLPAHEAALIRAGLASGQGKLNGMAVLEKEVWEHPDDPQVWYLLGEDYQHLGAQALVGREDADRAFGRAIKLDPSFAPAYLHLIENAFAWGDSARAARLLETYRQLAPGDQYGDVYALGSALAFGDSAGRARGWADLETLQRSSHLLTLSSLLSGPGGPRTPSLRGELLRFASQPGNRFAPLAVELFWTRIGRGEIRSASQELERASVPQEWKRRNLYALYSWGLPVPKGLLESSASRVDSSDIVQVFYGGAYAADRARWDEHAGALSRMRAIAGALRAATDTTEAEFADAAARGLEGYGWWRRGEKEKALGLLTVAQRQATGYHSREMLNACLRRWLGQLLEEVGRPRDALPYFESFQWYEVDPLVARERARLHEKLGDLERAREAYTFFVANWQNADPELQPRVEEARAALRRLTMARR